MNLNNLPMGKIKGIDVSSYQGNVNWAKVAKQGIKFAILRSALRSGNLDTFFEANYSGAKSAGLEVDVYQFSYALNAESAINDARNLIAKLNGKQVGIWLDLEWTDQGKLGKDQVTEIATAYINECKRLGYKCNIYSNTVWYQNYYHTDKLKALGCKFWIAKYGVNDGVYDESRKPNIGEFIWQYTSRGKIDGISGNVDLNMMYNDTTPDGGDKMYSIIKLVEIAKQEDGYLEKRKNCPVANLYEKVGAYVGADNWTKYWKDMTDLGLTNYQGSYYCIAAIFWCMVQAFGLKAAQDLCLQKFMINCQKTHDLFKDKGQVYTEPKIGDIAVFWNGNRFNHAELVVSVNDDVFKTCGFNTSAVTTSTVYNGGSCKYGKTYSASAMKKSGTRFCRPNYGTQFEEKWIKEGENWKYQLEDGTFVVSAWRLIDGKYYAFNEHGIMRSGWFYDNNQWYYLSGKEDGSMKTEWQLIDGKWFYFRKESGEMHTGWLQIDNNWYYLADENGSMVTDLQEINRMKYFFDSDGRMIASEWREINGNWYYFSSTGAAYFSRWKQGADGKWYYLKSDSTMGTNCYVKDAIDGVYYRVDTSGIWDGVVHKTIPSNATFVI